MSSIWPISAMCVWMALCIATVIQNSRLLRMFRERYPQIAQREIPFVFDNWRHPEKAIFFFRKRAVDILRPDPDLWRERQRFVALVVATLGFLLACGVAICILGILLT
jgi:hypothetical protein